MSLDLPDFTKRISIAIPDFRRLSKEIVLAKYGIQSIDTSGRPVFIENFANGYIQWCKWATGGGAYIALNTTEFSSAGFSCILDLGAPAGTSCRIIKLLPLITTGKVGIEFKFAVYITHGPLNIGLGFYTTNYEKWLSFYINYDDKEIHVYTEDWDSVLLDIPIGGVVSVCFFHTIKAVVNLDTNKVERVQYNQYNLDDLDIPIPTDEAAARDFMELDFYFGLGMATSGSILLDDIIVTIDED